VANLKIVTKLSLLPILATILLYFAKIWKYNNPDKDKKAICFEGMGIKPVTKPSKQEDMNVG